MILLFQAQNKMLDGFIFGKSIKYNINHRFWSIPLKTLNLLGLQHAQNNYIYWLRLILRVWIRVCEWMRVYTCEYREQRSISIIILQVLMTLFMKQDLVFTLCLGRLSSEFPDLSCLPLPSTQFIKFINSHYYSSFWTFEESNLGPYASKKSTLLN